jgi:hypothetical protein
MKLRQVGQGPSNTIDGKYGTESDLGLPWVFGGNSGGRGLPFCGGLNFHGIGAPFCCNAIKKPQERLKRLKIIEDYVS